MNRRCLLALAALVAVALPARAQSAPQLLSHDVYFSLNDASPAAREALVAACKKYLTGHPGLDRGRLGDVHRLESALRARRPDLLDEPRPLRGLHVEARDARALARETQRGRPSDPGRGAGHDHDFLRKGHRSSLPRRLV